jgi:hypothetical protein
MYFQKFLFLIENGADPNVKDSEGLSPINYAEENITFINQSLSNPGLKRKIFKALKKELEDNTQIVRILTAKMNNITKDSRFWEGYSYDNEDPLRSHIMPTDISDRGSMQWLAIDIPDSLNQRWIERRDLSDRLLQLLMGTTSP